MLRTGRGCDSLMIAAAICLCDDQVRPRWHLVPGGQQDCGDERRPPALHQPGQIYPVLPARPRHPRAPLVPSPKGSPKTFLAFHLPTQPIPPWCQLECCEGGERAGARKAARAFGVGDSKSRHFGAGAPSPKPTSESTYLPPDMLARGWLQALRRFPWAVI